MDYQKQYFIPKCGIAGDSLFKSEAHSSNDKRDIKSSKRVSMSKSLLQYGYLSVRDRNNLPTPIVVSKHSRYSELARLHTKQKGSKISLSSLIALRYTTLGKIENPRFSNYRGYEEKVWVFKD